MKFLYHLVFAISAFLYCNTKPSYAAVSDFDAPTIEQGAFSLQYVGTRFGDDAKANNNAQAHEFYVGYSPSDSLALTAGFALERSSDTSLADDAFLLEILHQLTDQKDGYWLNSAVFGGYAYRDNDRADTLETKLVLGYDNASTQTLANVVLEREIGNNRAEGVSFSSRITTIYPWKEAISPAIEWHADWGKLNDIAPTNQQSHFIGPAIYGTVFSWENTEGKDHAFVYEAAYNWGLTGASADNAARILIGYETAF